MIDHCVCIERLLIALLNYHNRRCVCVGRLFISLLFFTVSVPECSHGVFMVYYSHSICLFLIFSSKKKHYAFGNEHLNRTVHTFILVAMRSNLKQSDKRIVSTQRPQTHTPKKDDTEILLAHGKKTFNTKIREFRNSRISECKNKPRPSKWRCQWITCLFVGLQRAKKSSQFIFIFIFINIYRSLANFYTHNLELGVFTQIASVFGQFRPFGLRFSPLNEWFKWSVSFTYFNGDIFFDGNSPNLQSLINKTKQTKIQINWQMANPITFFGS